MKACLLAVLALALTGRALADVALVEDGEPVAEIVIAEDAVQGVKLAAEDLQRHLELISGARLKIVTTLSPHVKNRVYIGKSESTRKLGFKPASFESSGLEIFAKDDTVILDGPVKHWRPSPYQADYRDDRYLRSSVITGKVFSGGRMRWTFRVGLRPGITGSVTAPRLARVIRRTESASP